MTVSLKDQLDSALSSDQRMSITISRQLAMDLRGYVIKLEEEVSDLSDAAQMAQNNLAEGIKYYKRSTMLKIALQAARPVVANAVDDPAASLWQKETRLAILEQIDTTLKSV